MMRLPDPILALTLPSLHDDTILGCRVYHPACLSHYHHHRSRVKGEPSGEPAQGTWQRRAAVVAHPYAPMGGDWNNHVVAIVAGTLLCAGFVVVTFNFRGAHPSGGKTSWTAKPEIADCSSVIAFTAYYARNLSRALLLHLHGRPQSQHQSSSDSSPSRLPQPSTPELLEEELPLTLLMAGYSYGALVTSSLPPVSAILSPLSTPALGSAAAEIYLRAQTLAARAASLILLGRAMSSVDSMSPSLSSPMNLSPPHDNIAVCVGGDETVTPRQSNDSAPRRHRSTASLEHKVRESLGGLLEKTGLRDSNDRVRASAGGGVAKGARRSTGLKNGSDSASMLGLLGGDDMPIVRPAYLLISPLQGLASHLAAISFSPTTLFTRLTRARHDETKETNMDEGEAKMAINPTLAIFGDQDSFVHVSKLRTWAARMAAAPAAASPRDGDGERPPIFIPVEVCGAGHAWIEHGVASQLRDAVRHFATTVLV